MGGGKHGSAAGPREPRREGEDGWVKPWEAGKCRISTLVGGRTPHRAQPSQTFTTLCRADSLRHGKSLTVGKEHKRQGDITYFPLQSGLHAGPWGAGSPRVTLGAGHSPFTRRLGRGQSWGGGTLCPGPAPGSWGTFSNASHQRVQSREEKRGGPHAVGDRPGRARDAAEQLWAEGKGLSAETLRDEPPPVSASGWTCGPPVPRGGLGSGQPRRLAHVPPGISSSGQDPGSAVSPAPWRPLSLERNRSAPAVGMLGDSAPSSHSLSWGGLWSRYWDQDGLWARSSKLGPSAHVLILEGLTDLGDPFGQGGAGHPSNRGGVRPLPFKPGPSALLPQTLDSRPWDRKRPMSPAMEDTSLAFQNK